jgi:hypothetical protein
VFSAPEAVSPKLHDQVETFAELSIKMIVGFSRGAVWGLAVKLGTGGGNIVTGIRVSVEGHPFSVTISEILKVPEVSQYTT